MTARQKMLLTLTAVLHLGGPQPASAYIGPGIGLTAIGAGLAFIAAIILAIIGFFWYPIKRLWRALATRRAKAEKTPRGNLDS